MNLKLVYSKIKIKSEIVVTGSKSETNRLLLLQALFPQISLKNTSNSDDSEVMIEILNDFNQSKNQIPPLGVRGHDVHHAGTAMRFLTAYFAIQPNQEVILTGSSRMKERPMHVLVEALNSLGAQISYEEKAGFPPIRIKGKDLNKNEIAIEANTSSQFISALLLIAPKLKNGLKLNLKGEITSLPYIKMTLTLLKKVGVESSFENNIITVKPRTYNPQPATYNLQPTTDNLQPITVVVESDWSSASYFYSIVALSEIGTRISLSSYKKESLQGDAILSEIYNDFGVKTVFNENDSITISKVNDSINVNGNDNGNFNSSKNLEPRTDNLQPRTYNSQPRANNGQLKYNLNNAPDIAQTIAVTCFGLGIGCYLSGLHTLKIKETDRLAALKNELEKLGAAISVTDDSLHLKPAKKDFVISKNVSIATYQDHRMAMAFAPLALKTSLVIENAEVVSKSYPGFWADLKSIGFKMDETTAL